MFTGLSKDGKPIFVYRFTDWEDIDLLWSFQELTREQINTVLKEVSLLLLEWRTRNEKEILGDGPENNLPYPEWRDILKEKLGLNRFEVSFSNRMPHGQEDEYSEGNDHDEFTSTNDTGTVL